MNRPDIISTRIKTARKANGITQADLAELVPCSYRTIGAIERQDTRLSVDMAVAIAKVLNVRPAWLLDLEE